MLKPKQQVQLVLLNQSTNVPSFKNYSTLQIDMQSFPAISPEVALFNCCLKYRGLFAIHS